MIQFEQIPASRRTPGIETEINTRGASQNPPSSRPKIMLVGQRMAAKISTPSFVPSAVPGLDDLVLGTAPAAPTFTGSVLRKFIIEITTEAATDIFKWSKDNGENWTANVNAATEDITLAEGVDVKFGAVTGHKVGDRWTFFAFPAGTVAQKVPTNLTSLGEARSYTGQGSILFRTIRTLLLTAEKYGSVDMNFTAMDDAGAGVAADGALQVVGTASAAGYFKLKIGKERFQVGYSSGTTPEAIALLLKAELDKDPGLDLQVMTHRLAGTLSKLIFTAKNAGTQGNDIQISYECTPNTGVSGTVTAMANGVTDPSNFEDALDAFAAKRYHIIGNCLNDATNFGSLSDHLLSISSSTKKKYAIGIVGTNTGTLATATALAAGINYERTQLIHFKGSKSAGYEILGAYCALRGYIEAPQAQLTDLRLYGLDIPDINSRITDDEVETALQNGVCAIKVDENEQAAVSRGVTTRAAENWAVDISTILTLDDFVTAFQARCKSVFAHPNNTNTADKPEAVRAQAIFVAEGRESLGRLKNVAQYIPQFVVEQDESDATRINIAIPSPVVPGLHRICGRFDLIYG